MADSYKQEQRICECGNRIARTSCLATCQQCDRKAWMDRLGVVSRVRHDGCGGPVMAGSGRMDARRREK